MIRLPKVGERIRFPETKLGQELIVHHTVESFNGSVLVWCTYPKGDQHPFIGKFADGSFNNEAEIIEP